MFCLPKTALASDLLVQGRASCWERRRCKSKVPIWMKLSGKRTLHNNPLKSYRVVTPAEQSSWRKNEHQSSNRPEKLSG